MSDVLNAEMRDWVRFAQEVRDSPYDRMFYAGESAGVLAAAVIDLTARVVAAERERDAAVEREQQYHNLWHDETERAEAAVRAGGNAADRVATLEAALREIAAYDSRNETTGCRCGHKMAFCHLVNAEMYCGGETALIARHALGECPPVCTVCIREEQAALSRSSGAAAASGDGQPPGDFYPSDWAG